MRLQLWIAAGLILGLAAGLLTAATQLSALETMVEVAAPFGTAFVKLVRMVVIPLVATTLFSGVAGLGNLRKLGRLGGSALALFWGVALMGILLGMGIMALANQFAPATIETSGRVLLSQDLRDAAGELPGLVDFLVGLVPVNPVGAAAEGSLLQLIVFVAFFGAAAGSLPEKFKEHLIDIADGATQALIRMVDWILLTAPLGVFALAAPVTARLGWSMLQSLGVFVLAVAVGLLILVAAVYLPLAVFGGRVPSAKFLKGSIAPIAVAASTTSSAATLPVLLESAERDLGISRPVAGLVLSMAASLNRAGSALFQGAAVVFLAGLFGVSLSAGGILAAVLATFLVSLTVASVPSASVVTLAPALGTLGIPLDGLAILLGIDRIPDMMRTATNCVGHLSVTTAVERSQE